MPIIVWDDAKLSVNVKGMDLQHRKLIDLINRLYDAMMEGKGNEILGGILRELVDYTIVHFGNEERLLKQYEYPDLALQEKEHEYFKKKIAEMRDGFEKSKMGLTLNVMNFLKDWLANHIMKNDKRYGPFLNSKGVV